MALVTLGAWTITSHIYVRCIISSRCFMLWGFHVLVKTIKTNGSLSMAILYRLGECRGRPQSDQLGSFIARLLAPREPSQKFDIWIYLNGWCWRLPISLCRVLSRECTKNKRDSECVWSSRSFYSLELGRFQAWCQLRLMFKHIQRIQTVHNVGLFISGRHGIESTF